MYRMQRPPVKMILIFAAFFGLLKLWQQLESKSPAPAHRTGSAAAIDSRDVEPPRRKSATARADFDFYLLALTWHPAFCADGNDDKAECATSPPHPLAIHGLWPEKLASGAYPHDCRAPRLDLAPGLSRDLEEYMPGMQSNLHVHEWRKHGGCSGLDDDRYFGQALERARFMDSALGAELTTHAGAETTPGALRAAADRYSPGLGATLTLHCRTLREAPARYRSRPYLVEIRQCIDDDGADGAPLTALACSAVDRRDQGCGNSFRIAALAP